MGDIGMHKVMQCRASRDYRLWLRFDDGLEGSVFLGNMLEGFVVDIDHWRHVFLLIGAVWGLETARIRWIESMRRRQQQKADPPPPLARAA